MLVQTALFYFFATGLVLTALGVVFLKNPVHSALSLVLTFVASACLWLMLQAEFLALILVLVYVGAVMTLFLFVVMTLDLDIDIQKQTFVRYFPLGILLMGILGAILIFVFHPASNLFPNLVEHSENYSNIKSLGNSLYTQYAYPFELAAILLLIAIIAAISLNPHKIIKPKKVQDIERQTDIRKSDRVRLVTMPSEKKP